MIKSKDMSKPSFNMLNSGTELNGNIVIDGDFRFDGKLNGNLKCKGKLTLGNVGYIEGNIDCEGAEISGEVKGTIISSSLVTLKECSTFNGDITTEKIKVEAGAKLSMSCNTQKIY